MTPISDLAEIKEAPRCSGARAPADPCLTGDDATHTRSHCPIKFTFLDHAFVGFVGAFDAVLELVVFDRHKLRDLINPNRTMPAGKYVVHTFADFEFVSSQFVLHARIKAASRLKFPREHDFRPKRENDTGDGSLIVCACADLIDVARIGSERVCLPDWLLPTT
jgi:hypothetical protein